MTRRQTPQEVEDLVRRYAQDLHSAPPPAGMTETRDRVIGRMHRDRIESGQWDVEELVRLAREQSEKLATQRLTDEVDRRKQAEAKIAEMEKANTERRTEQVRWWMGILGKVVEWAVVGTLAYFAAKVIK